MTEMFEDIKCVEAKIDYSIVWEKMEEQHDISSIKFYNAHNEVNLEMSLIKIIPISYISYILRKKWTEPDFQNIEQR